jgi:hypothetical protein
MFWLVWQRHTFPRLMRTGMTQLGIPRAHAEAADEPEWSASCEITQKEIIVAIPFWKLDVASLVIDNSANGFGVAEP